MADTIFTNQTPATSDFDGGAHAWGMKFTVSDNCSCTGGRAWVPSGGRPATFYWQLWRVGDSALLAESNLQAVGHGTPSSNAWMSFGSSLFSTPGDVDLETGETYVVNVFFNGGGGGGVFTDPGSFPASSGGLVSSSTGRFNNGSAQNVMPGTDYGAFFFADVDAETAGGATHDAAGTAAGTGAASATATVDRQATGTAAGTGASSSAASVDRQSAGTAAATGEASAVADVTREASGAALAAGTASAAATVTRQAAGTAAATATASATATIDPGGIPSIPAAWSVDTPELKWHAGPPESKWHVGAPEVG